MGESGGDDPTLPAGACEHRQPPRGPFRVGIKEFRKVCTDRDSLCLAL